MCHRQDSGHTLVEETSSRLSDDVMSDMLVDSLE